MADHEPLSEEQLHAITVGELRPRTGRIVLVEYDLAWPERFAREAEHIRAVLGERVLQLEHVGSTSVPGLCAKPVIDVLLVVADATDEPAYAAPLVRVGFVLRIREPEWHEHRLLKGADEDVNVHVFSTGCVEIERMLRFRDWLRANGDDRELYARTKRELAARDWRYTQQYADAKTAVVEAILARAESPEHSSASHAGRCTKWT